MKHVLISVLFLCQFTACRSVEDLTGSTPIIDTKGVNIAQYNKDLAECQAFADEVQIAQKTASGAITGAAIGAVFGAVLGNSNTAQRGTGVGAVGGGARGAGEGIREREHVIKNCLAGRGYRVLN